MDCDLEHMKRQQSAYEDWTQSADSSDLRAVKRMKISHVTILEPPCNCQGINPSLRELVVNVGSLFGDVSSGPAVGVGYIDHNGITKVILLVNAIDAAHLSHSWQTRDLGQATVMCCGKEPDVFTRAVGFIFDAYRNWQHDRDNFLIFDGVAIPRC